MAGAHLDTGTPVTQVELTRRDFSPFQLQFRNGPSAQGTCEWNTLGSVPDAPGLYAFVLTDRCGYLRVTYVGFTSNLWLVTKGRLPSGASRRGHRYGRPKYATSDRSRISGLVCQAIQEGFEVGHWLSPRHFPPELELEVALTDARDNLIRTWRTTKHGWNTT